MPLRITLTRPTGYSNHVIATSEFGTETDYFVPITTDGRPAYLRTYGTVSQQQVFDLRGDAILATPATLLSVVENLIRARLGNDAEVARG